MRLAEQEANLSLSLTLAKRLQLEEDQASMRALAAAGTTTAAATATASAPASGTTTAAAPTGPRRARAVTRSVLMAERATGALGDATSLLVDRHGTPEERRDYELLSGPQDADAVADAESR